MGWGERKLYYHIITIHENKAKLPLIPPLTKKLWEKVKFVHILTIHNNEKQRLMTARCAKRPLDEEKL